MREEAWRRYILKIPKSLHRELAKKARENGVAKNHLALYAVSDYIRECRRIELKEQLRVGYLKMGSINLDIAEKALLSDESALRKYEEFLSECEMCDSETR